MRYSYYSRRKTSSGELIFYLVILMIGIVVALSEGIIKCCNERTITTTVTDKGVKRHGESNDKYLVYTDDGTYEITDSLFWPRFDSSDLYGCIEVGKTYQFTVAGYRVPLLTMYPNIYEAKAKE
jgi:hypothetical protein